MENLGTKKVKYIVAVASGKGGVGKSTVSTQLALSLKSLGKKVGLLDADLYGPSQPKMLGGQETPKGNQGAIVPIDKYGVKFISMGVLSNPDSPVVMRAPLAIKAIQQFLSGVLWGELDYLLIDLPPGTGDIQLTLAQQAHLTGAIIVTTPQKVALEIAQKGLKMFQQVNVPILGIVENMSGFTCPHCEKETKIFNDGGGEQVSKAMDIPLLGKIPLDPEIMMSGDEGLPLIEKNPELSSAKAFLNLAKTVDEKVVSTKEKEIPFEPEKIQVYTDEIQIHWKDGNTTSHKIYDLRVSCPCAACVDETSGKRTLNPKDIPLDISASQVRSVGRYGMSVNFSDGHNTGIFQFKKLKKMNKETSFTV